MKVQVNGEFRRIYRIPKNLDELKEFIADVFGSGELFNIEYKIGDCLIRISSNKDYQKHITRNASEKTIKLILSDTNSDTPPNEITITSPLNTIENPINPTVNPNPADEPLEKNKSSYSQFTNIHEGILCSECKIFPIAGIRFKCILCQNFDICEFCEDILNHPHPFLKLKTPIQCYQNYVKIISAFNKSTQMPGLKDVFVKKVKTNTKKKFKLKVKQYLFNKLACFNSGSSIQLAWNIVNKGTQAWPAGSKLSLKKGELVCDDFVIGEKVEPGSCVMVKCCVKAPDEAKDYLGVWEIDTGVKKFGKITAQFKIGANEKIKEMTNCGYGFNKLSNIKNK